MLNIALIDSVPPDFAGGYEHFIVDTARYLSSGGHNVTVIYPPTILARSMYRILSGRKMITTASPLVPLQSQPIPFKAANPTAASRLLRNQDVVYVKNEPHELAFTLAALHNSSTKVVVGFHTAPPPAGPESTQQFRRRIYWTHAYRHLYNRVDAVHVLQNDSANFVEEVLRYPAIRTALIPNGVDLGRFQYKDSDRGDLFTIVFVGRLDRDKGADLLPSFAELLESLLPFEFRLLVVGEGPLKSQLKIATAGMSSVAILGYVEDISKLFARAHAVIAPSRRETNAIVPAEAMSCGVPIILTNIPASASYISAGARAVTSGSVRDMVRETLSIAELWRNDRLAYRSLCGSLHQYAEANLDCQLRQSQLLNLFESVTSRSARRKV